MKLRSIDNQTKCGGKANVAAKAVLLSSLAAGACAPEVTIHNRYYDPNAPPDAGCTSIASCAPETVYLREKGNPAGSSEGKAGNITVRFIESKDFDGTKQARIEFEGCGKKAESKFVPGASSTVTVGRDVITVKLDSLGYDGAGLKLDIIVTPVCNTDGGAKAKEAGSKG